VVDGLPLAGEPGGAIWQGPLRLSHTGQWNTQKHKEHETGYNWCGPSSAVQGDNKRLTRFSDRSCVLGVYKLCIYHTGG
jgi:hypothetical protein